MGKLYYVDSENVGEKWIGLIDELDTDTSCYVFYTDKSPHLSYENVIKLINNKNPNSLSFIPCVTGNNALDFQLVTYLGYQVKDNPNHEFIIVSNDTGFDSVVHFWRDKGINVNRRNISSLTQIPLLTNDIPNEIIPVSDCSEIAEAVTSVNQTKNKICGIDKDTVDHIISAVTLDKPSQLHVFLIHFYGKSKGLELYRTVTSKSYKPDIFSMSKSERITVLLNYIIHFEKPDAVPRDFIPFVVIHHKDGKQLGAAIIKKYGDIIGTPLKKMMKSYQKTIAQL